MLPRTLSIDELADYLHVSRRHVQQLLQEGEMPCVLRGGRMLFERAEIDAWASQRLLRLPGKSLDWYHRKTMEGTRQYFPRAALIPALLPPDYIDLSLRAKTRSSLIHAMVALAESTGRVFDARELRDSVESREALCSTALPGGLALLHPRQQQSFRFEGSFLVLGRTVQSIPYGASDGHASRLFFLICCENERIHLHTLARLCLLARKTKILEQLRAAPDAASAHAALVAAEISVLPTPDAEPAERRKKRSVS
jgi:excisionase family DNA binding protein